MSEEKTINQFGEKSIYIERNEGTIFVSSYVAETASAFDNASFELKNYLPSIKPKIYRDETEQILKWIEQDEDVQKPKRVALLYGKAGIGKSVVMHELLEELNQKKDCAVLGLKSDQVEFVDTNDLAKKMYLAKPLEVEIKELTRKVRRVVLLIDQIDALSLSLSSNRTPLRSLLKLIAQVRSILHVRVVISCRPYDLEYDPVLEQLHADKKWELREFTPEQVKDCLAINDCKDELTTEMLRFLGNPLHLYLFLKVRNSVQLSYPLTEDSLYSALWNVYIRDVDRKNVNIQKLIRLLDELTNRMYERQELSVSVAYLETEYVSELSYLLSTNILNMIQNNKVQFFHQTMFDYVYARRFAEKGCDLLVELKQHHQGLFVRSTVKSVLAFQRSSDPKQYITMLRHLLFDQNENGEVSFRFHLKSLALSSMVFFEEPIPEEITFITNKLYADEKLMGVLIDAIHNWSWFAALKALVDGKGGWRFLSESHKNKIIAVCRRLQWNESDRVLDFANEILDLGGEANKTYVTSLLDTCAINSSGEKLKQIYLRLVTSRNPLQMISILKNLAASDPQFVIGELRQNIILQLEEKEHSGMNTVQIGHEVESIYDTLEKDLSGKMLDFYLELFELILAKKSYLIPEHAIKNSLEFSHFQRSKGANISYEFTKCIANKILDAVIAKLDAGDQAIKDKLYQLSQKELDGLVYVALYAYSHKPTEFQQESYDLIIGRKLLADAPCWLEYQATELLKTIFPNLNSQQQDDMVTYIMSLNPKDERVYYQKEHIKYGIPITQMGHRRGTVLNLLPEDIIRQKYWDAYQELLRMRRKFKYLENNQPFRSSSFSGWPSMSRAKTVKMSLKEWYRSMEKYNTDAHNDWNIPSLTGQKMLFRDSVKSDPGKFLPLIEEVVSSENIPIGYAIAGFQGLIDANCFGNAEKIFNGIVNLLGGDVNATPRDFSLYEFLLATEGFIDKDRLPQCVFDFLCQIVKYAEEDLSYRNESGNNIYNRGINQCRGNAGYILVKCANFEKYGIAIFETLESIAETASEFTRSAILLNMAVLNHIDKERNLKLFFRLMHDYHPQLMAMPVHNYNPLVYFVNYGFDQLIDFFHHALEVESCYKEQVIFLWLAWTHTRHSVSKKLLDDMSDSSEIARLSLLKFFCQPPAGKLNEDAVEYICKCMQPQYDSDEMGVQCDAVFYNIDSCNPLHQERIAITYLESPVSAHVVKGFYGFLAVHALVEPVQTLNWLELIVGKRMPEDFASWNKVADILIQAYNGIKSFNDEDYQGILEKAMDLMDKLLQNPENKYMMSNFLNKLDNE